jgi:hypothetical protein
MSIKRFIWLSLVYSLHTKKIFFILNVKSRQFYIHVTCSLKMLDDATVDFVKFTQWPTDSPGLNQIAMCVMNLNNEYAKARGNYSYP